MAYNNIDQAVTLPNQFDKPGDVWQSAIERKDRTAERQAAQAERDRAFAERQREFDERQLDRNQQEEFRKIQMINEYTDLTKHQTGSDVANAVGDKIVRTQIPAFVEMAKKGASYSDLYGAIVKGVGNTATAMDGIKKELLEADSAAKLLKEKFGKSIDTDAVLKIARADIVNRRLDKEHSFVNPLTVAPSEFTPKLADPRFLSKFITSDEDLANEIINPKGMDKIAVPTGTADAHNTYEAQIPYWKQPNFTPEILQKGGGFLPSGFVPQLKTKSEVIPLEKLPKEINENKPFTIADKGVYDRFVENPKTNLQLISKTRKAYPNYDNFSDLEKEYAERHVLLNTIESLDRSNFRYKSTTRPARTNINIGDTKNQTNDFVLRFKKATEKGTVDDMVNVAREMFAGNGSAEFVNLGVNKKDKGISITYKKKLPDGLTEEVEEKINPTDPNFYYKLANIYQKVTGSDAKLEGKIFGGKADYSNPNAQQKQGAKKAKVYKGLDKNGNPIFE